MTKKTTPLCFSFLSFGEDELTSAEEIFMIDDNTIIFNSDCVRTAQIDSVDKNTAVITVHLKTGIIEKKNFDISNLQIREIK